MSERVGIKIKLLSPSLEIKKKKKKNLEATKIILKNDQIIEALVKIYFKKSGVLNFY